MHQQLIKYDNYIFHLFWLKHPLKKNTRKINTATIIKAADARATSLILNPLLLLLPELNTCCVCTMYAPTVTPATEADVSAVAEFSIALSTRYRVRLPEATHRDSREVNVV